MVRSLPKNRIAWLVLITTAGIAFGNESLSQELSKRFAEPNRANISFAVSYPKESITLLEKLAEEKPLFKKLLPLFQGEDALRNGEQAQAVEHFIEFSSQIEPASSSLSYQDGAIPYSFYPQTPRPKGGLQREVFLSNIILLSDNATFVGLGSGTDNLLIRRFLELERTDLATHEYSRLQEVHLKRSKFLRNRLQFTWDHSLFLQKSEQTKKATSMLITTLLDIPHFENPRAFTHHFISGGPPPQVMETSEFIRLVTSFLKTSQQTETAIAKLEAGKTPSHFRTLAEMYSYLGKDDLSLKWHLLALEESHLAALPKAELLGDLYFDREDYESAALHYHKAIAEVENHPMQKGHGPRIEDRLYHLEQLLESCYLKLNDSVKRLHLHLRQMERSKHLQPHQWTATLRLAALPETEPAFRKWALRMSGENSPFDPARKAFLFEYLDDFSKVAQALLTASSESHFNAEYWEASFREHGQLGLYRETLKSLADQNPRSTPYLHSYLELYGKEANPQHAISFYEEALLDRFSRPTSRVGPSHYANHLTSQDEITRNLLSLYLKEEQEHDFIKLGKTLLDPESELSTTGSLPDATRYFINQAKRATLRECKEEFALNSLHLEFRLQGWEQARDHGTGNLIRIDEDNAALLSSNYCRCLTSSPDYLISGHEWGLTVYSAHSQSPSQIIIGSSISALAIYEETVFATDGARLFQVDLDTGTVAQLENPHPRKEGKLDLTQNIFGGERITGLGTTADTLWVGGSSSIFQINLQSHQVTTYSPQELGVTRGQDWSRFFPLSAGGLLASGRDQVSRRLNPVTEHWEEIPPVITVLENDEIWIKQRVNNRLGFRPARYHLITCEIEIVPIRKGLDQGHWGKAVRDIDYLGRYQGELVFSLDREFYLYDRQAHELRFVPKDSLPGFNPETANSCHWKGQHTHFSTDSLNRSDMNPHANAHFRYGTLKYFYRYSELSTEQPDGTQKTLSDFSLRGTVVYDLVEAPEGIFLCTSRGITLVNKAGEILSQFDSRQGLPVFPCVTAASFNDKLYFGFAADGIFVLSENEFKPLTTMDGLLDDRIHNLVVENGRLKVTYASRSRNDKPFQYPKSFIAPDGSHHYSTTEATPRKRYDETPSGRIPFLGGQQCGSIEIDEQIWSYGTSGVLISSRKVRKEKPFPTFPLQKLVNPMLAQKKEAKTILAEQRLDRAERIQHPNPFIAIEAGYEGWYDNPENLARLLDLSRHEFHEIRREAVRYLYPNKGPLPIVRNVQVMARLEEMLDDPDREVRHRALQEKCLSYSEKVPTAYLQKLIGSDGELPEGTVQKILTRNLPIDLETLKLILDHPKASNAWTHLDTHWLPKYEFVGRQISQHEELLMEILQTSHDRSKNRNDSRWLIYPLMVHFEKATLPLLHRSLQSSDRVVRANAALACGAIGDPSSIEPLIAALDFESGLSRASIVFALGRLKAESAIPLLLAFDKQLQASASSRYPSGVALMNAMPYTEPEQVYHPTDNELKLPNDPDQKAARPEREILLSRKTIFEALFEISSPLVQPYFRAQALQPHYRYNRRLPILQKLAEGEGEDIPKNIETLKSSLSLKNSPKELAEIQKLLTLLREKQQPKSP